MSQPAAGEPLYYSLAFNAGDIQQAYVDGARSGRKHHEASDHLIERSADAYVKLQFVTRDKPSAE